MEKYKKTCENQNIKLLTMYGNKFSKNKTKQRSKSLKVIISLFSKIYFKNFLGFGHL